MKRLLPLLFLLCGTAHAQGYLADVVHSSTSVLLPPICLRALDDTPAGGTLKSGITSATSGLQISEKSDNEATWTDYPTANINAKSSAIGTWETPDANDVHFSEAESEGCYQIDFPDTTWSNTSAKYVTIKISDTTSPTFADTVVTVNLNAIAAATLVDNIWSEPCAGHTTSDTPGDQVCDQFDTLESNVASLPADVWQHEVEDQGSGYQARCVMSVLLAALGGEWSTVGGVATFEDPSGGEVRLVGSYSSGGRDTITITCPTYTP